MTIEECWEKYKHLDCLLSDYECMMVMLGFRGRMFCDCWQAIRDGREKLYDARLERENE